MGTYFFDGGIVNGNYEGCGKLLTEVFVEVKSGCKDLFLTFANSVLCKCEHLKFTLADHYLFVNVKFVN